MQGLRFRLGTSPPPVTVYIRAIYNHIIINYYPTVTGGEAVLKV